MADGMMQYFAKIGLDASAFLNGINLADKGLLALYRDASVSLAATGMLFDRLSASVQKYGQMANQLRDLSYNTGIGTDRLQKMQYAAMLSGTEFSTVSGGLSKLTLSMDEAISGTDEYVQAFNTLGVNPTGKTPGQVFEETTAALMKMEDPVKRNAAANTIFGRSWKELLPYMETYLEKRGEIEKYNGLNEKELKDLQDAKVAWDGIANAVTIYTGKIITQYNSDNLNSVLTLDRAYRKLFTGDIKGFMDEAQAYHTNLAKSEAYKINDVIKGNQAITGDTDPLKTKTEQEAASKKAIDAITDAMREYKNALSDVADEQERLNDINREYYRDISTVNVRDTAQVRSLMMRHQWDVEDQNAAINKAGGVAMGAAGNLMNSAVQATNPGITIAGPIYVNGDKSFEKMIAQTNRENGIGIY